ncbi:MAG: GTPase Era [Oscillospiraceae bacterium]|nr:GTPase Era [Oscillospiraceae bacterium]
MNDNTPAKTIAGVNTESSSAFRSGFITIIGRANVGKSTLTNALVGEKIAIVSDKPQTTRNRILGVLNVPGGQMVFLDTPGLTHPRGKLGAYMQAQAFDALDGADALLIVAAAGQIGPQDRDIISRMGKRKLPKILAINKADAASRETLARDLASLDVSSYDDVIPISALRGDNLEPLKAMLFARMPEGPKYFPDDMITDQPERIMCAEIIREKALQNLREEVPHGVGVEMQRIEAVSDALTEIHATVYVERSAHKSIVIGKRGSMLGKIGTAARMDIERLLGVHVALKLWVKVREDWRNRADDLRTLGYIREKG